MNIVGVLDQNLKRLMEGNSIELSAIEGNIISAAGGREVKTILVTSCSDLEGKTTSAVSMAYGLSSKLSKKVILVDGNFHSPKISKLFAVDQVPGLSDLILYGVSYNKIVRKTEEKNLHIVTHGSELSEKYDVFETRKFETKLDPMKPYYHYIIVDGHSVFGSSDVSLVARYFDGIIFVVECEKTRWEVLQQAKEKINGVGGKILGVVLNKRKFYIPRKIYGKT